MSDETNKSALPAWYASLLRRRRLLAVFVVAKRMRTGVAFVVGAFCAALALTRGLRPAGFPAETLFIIAGCALIVLGTLLRVGALGILHKKQLLATKGVYSLCRHPLYLGSMLIVFGFCCLLEDGLYWAVACSYFALFYTLTIVWEEIRLREHYGETHAAYARHVPLLLPRGHWAGDSFSWNRARQRGAVWLCVVLALLGSVTIWLRVTGAAPFHNPAAAFIRLR